MAGTWFNGVMGTAMQYSVFQNWNGRARSSTFTGNSNIDGQMGGGQQVNNNQSDENTKNLESRKSQSYVHSSMAPKHPNPVIQLKEQAMHKMRQLFKMPRATVKVEQWYPVINYLKRPVK